MLEDEQIVVESNFLIFSKAVFDSFYNILCSILEYLTLIHSVFLLVSLIIILKHSVRFIIFNELFITDLVTLFSETPNDPMVFC